MNELREAVGVLLRLPVVATLAGLWMVTIWPIAVAFTILFAVLALVGLPALYPFIYTGQWLKYAFLGKKDPVLPEYWKGYHQYYLEIVDVLKFGFPTLKRWLMEGWQ